MLNPYLETYQGGVSDAFVAKFAPQSSTCCDNPGDANNNGTVDISDLTYFVTYLFGGGDAPVDCIIVTCAPAKIPQPLIDQLADGGRLVIPVGDDWQELILLTRDGDNIKRVSITSVRFVPMTGEADRQR